MRLEEIVAEVRPREPREAQDLGFTLARQWFRQLLLVQALAALPYIVVALVLGLFIHPLCGLIFFVWFRPMMDRWGLSYVSQAMFGNPPTLKKLASDQLSGYFRHAFYGLAGDRLDLKRSMMMPVAYLEGVTGERLRRRRKVVSDHGGDVGSILSMWFGLFALLFTWSILFFFYLMLPRGMGVPIEELLLRAYESDADDHLKLWWIYATVWSLVLIFLSPFYICAGFVLYLNSRSHQEGWDIEIVFRKLALRLEGNEQKEIKRTPQPNHMETSGQARAAGRLTAVILMAVGTYAGSSLVHAQNLYDQWSVNKVQTRGSSEAQGDGVSSVEADRHQTPEKAISELLATDTFKRHERVIRRLKSSNKNKKNTATNQMTGSVFSLGNVLKALAIGALLLMICYLAYLIYLRLRNSQKRAPGQSGENNKVEPVVVQTKLSPALPVDVPQQAMTLWQQGKHLHAMSMLYRGMLEALCMQFGLQFGTGETEYECRRHIRKLNQKAVVTYCEKLMRLWLDCRYAGKLPSQDQLVMLCRSWPFQQKQSLTQATLERDARELH